MKAITKIMAGAAGLAALAASAPAAAQYYPGYGYGGYGGYGGANVVSQILNSILGGRSYASNDRYAVEQCVRGVENYINTRGLDDESGRYGRYGQYGYGYGYNNGYGNGYMGARVTSVTDVRHRSSGGVKVYGYATTGADRYGGYGNNGYGYDRYGYGSYGYNGQADARFVCSIDRYGRISDIDASHNYAGVYPYRRY